MKFTLTILGSGPSLGVPVPACSCHTCLSSNPKNSRLRTSAFIKTETGVGLLIDASPDIRQQVLKFAVDRIDGVLMTHEHADHSLGIDYLRTFNFIQKESIPIVATPRILNIIKRQFEYIFFPDPQYTGGGLPSLIPTEIDDMTPFTIRSVPIQPFRMLHGNIFATGFRIGSIAYATDCHEIPQASLELLKGVKYLIIDGLGYKKTPTHFSIDEAIAVGQSVGAERTFLIHMTHHVEHEELAEKLPKNVSPSFDGLTLEGFVDD
jgi:phosphoribosyl 1,2-cyclic phosphate phosphodiesterase